MSAWPKEEIPDSDRLFMRVHRIFVQGRGLAPGVFRDHETGMSTDWEKYATSRETLERARKPGDNGVISFVTGAVRSIAELQVEHEPLYPDHRAHTEILGQKSPEVRLKLLRLTSWEVPLVAPQE